MAPQGTGVLSTQYWIGVAYNTTINSWVLQGGGDSGNGQVSNANPYAHWSYDFQDVRVTYPKYTCVSALSTRKYDQVRGKPGMPVLLLY